MVKKLLFKVITFWALILTSALGWGQACPTSVSISADTGKTICEGTPVTFTATINGGTGTFSYQWKIDGANIGTDSNTYSTSNLENGDNVTLTVTSSDDTSCSTTSSEYTMTVNSNKTPTVSITANKTSICPGDSVTFTASNTNGGTSPQYSFFLNNGTSALQTGSSNKFNTTSLIDGDRIRVVLTSSVECTTSDTAEAFSNNITVRAGTPSVPGTIATSIGTEICPGTSQTYSISAVEGASSYQWTLPSGWTGSSTSTSINATAGTSGGTISVKAINDCGTSEAQNLSITLKAGTPATPGNITGETAVCPGVEQTYSIAAVNDATEYIWTLPSGWSGTSNTNSITVTTGTSGSGSISVQAKNDCGTSAAKTLAVSVKAGTPVQPGTISGIAAVCPGVSETYSITAVTGATSYEWTFPDNSWTGTSTTNSITVTTGTTDGNITVKAINDCGTSTEQIFAVTVKPGTPATPGAISGSDIVCPGTSETYSVTPLDGATEYIWTLPSGWSGSSTTEEITVTTGDSGSGNITVKAKNDCGTSTAASFSVSVDKPAPIMTGTITGDSEVCSTATGLVYSIPAITNATEYEWNLPTGWNITAGSGTNSITVSASSTSGNIFVIAKNTCGDSAASANFPVTSTTGKPVTPGEITTSLPSTAICPPLSNQTFSVTPVDGASSYIWTLPTGWEITSGANTSSITVNITAAQSYQSPTTVTVKAKNICGESGTSTSQEIYLDNYIIADIGPDQTICKKINPIPQLTLNGNMSFGNANLSPQFTTSGSGTFQNIPTNKKGNFTVNYTPTQADYDLGQVKITMTIPQITQGNTTSCGTGKDEMIIFFKPLPTVTITATSPVCSGNTSVLTFTGTPNSRVTYKLPSGTNQTVDIGSSGTATVTTAALTANSTYTLVSSVNLDTPACSNTLSESATVTITPRPTAEIVYSGAPFCTSLTTGQDPTLTGTGAYNDGVYSSTTGLTIDASTGAIIPSTSTPGTYTVTYKTLAAGGCEEVIATTEVTITKEPTATISYSGTPFCTSDSDAKPVTLEGTDNYTGGTFSAPEGLTIDTDTGAITASSSTAGTYTVTYQTPEAGGCSPVPATTEVTITEAPTPSINYEGTPFCHSDTSVKEVTLAVAEAFLGGDFKAPSGVSIDASSGAITPASSTPGTYEITYTTPASDGCGEVTATTSITITETPSAEISYSGPYCTSDATAHVPAFTNSVGAYQGGVFRSTPDGLSLDTSTGAINANNSSPNTYTVIYEIPAGEGCGTSEISTSVTITQAPQLDISYTTPLCTSDTVAYPVTFSNVQGAYQGGTFTATSGLAIDSEGNIIAANSTPGIHTITYTTPEANGCGPVEVTTDVEIFEQVVITSPPVNVGICSTEPASFEVVASGDNLAYEWKRTDGAAITNATGINTAKLSFNNATATNAGEYFVEITGSSPCTPANSDPVTLNVDENIVIIKPTEDLTFCDQEREGVTFEYIAHANGAALTFTWIKDGADISNATSDRYSFTTTGPSGDNGEYSGTMTISGPNPADNGVYAVRISGPDYFTCSDATSKTFTLNVTPLPEPPTTEPVVLCQGETAEPLSASGVTGATFKWYNAAMEPINGVPTPSTVDAGNTSYFVTQITDVCESNPTELVVTVNPTPAVPTTQEAVIYCFEEEDVAALTATGTDANSVINWYGPDDSTVALSAAPTPLTTSTGNTKYWVSQSIGDCESELVEIVVTVKPLPELVVTADSQDICEGSSTTLYATGAETYVWSLDGNEIGTTADITITPEAAGSYTYKVTGTDTFGCVNTNEIIIDVETPSDGGELTGPSSVCTGENSGTLTVSNYLGEIVRWESSTDGTTWTAISETSAEYTFQNLAAQTQFRAVVKNGVCDEAYSSAAEVTIDPLPIGGELAFDGIGRILETCSNPGSDFNVSLSLSGQTGDVVRWRYKEGAATDWSYVEEGSDYFTGTTLSPELIRSLSINQSTIFEVEIGSGACTPNAISQNATLSILSSDIAPNPVQVTPGVVCLGEEVTLSGSTGYGTGPGMEAGAFDYSSITNKGWRITDNEGNYSNFDSSADNGVAAIWLRTNPLPLTTANLTSPYSTYTYSNWDSSAGDEGNKGFAVVSGPNQSTLETSVFNLFAVDNPVLTFDQAYNLTPGSAIYVDISTDGGATYNPVPLFELIATDPDDGSSGNYDSFGDDDANAENKMELDLTEFAGLDNLRIRFRYEGTRDGDVWAVDAISLPVEPTNVDLTWTDYTDPENPVVIGKNTSEQWTPKLIGWNDFEIRTKLTFDSTGQQCDTLVNWKTISVFVFDQYTSTATAVAGSCGASSVPLTAEVLNSQEVDVAGTKTLDGYEGEWEVVSGPSGYSFSTTHFSNDNNELDPLKDPAAIFTPGVSGDFTLRWVLSTSAVGADGKSLANETCPPTYNNVSFSILDCTALDFDGVDDYVDLGEDYTGDYSIEAWIRPEASTGTIISTPQLEINMEDLPNAITPDTRWYHIAVDSDGKLYVDGIATGTTISTTGTARAFIGARWNSPNAENHFSGWIEEVRIWNGNIAQEQIQFLMNQRLQNAGNIGVEIPLPAPGLAYGSLAGYYQLLADNILNGGYTTDLATSAVNGKLRNMETFQENTAPLPYTTARDNYLWTDEGEAGPWTNWDVWDIPHANGINGTPITWNIVKTSNYVESGAKDIIVLGLIVESNELDILSPSGAHDETNSGQRLEVTHYLKIDGLLDLTGESQLLQPMGSIVGSSAGALERDQQGTASSFNYNYWSSPVSPGSDNAPYTVKSVMLDGSDSSTPKGLDFGAPYAYADGGESNPRKISTYWLHKFHGTANNYFSWEWIGADGELNVGEGYSMKGTEAVDITTGKTQNYTFKGLPNNGTITMANMSAADPGENYLIGNPYPSAINADQFIDDNIAGGKNIFNGTLYFWDHFSGMTHYLQEYIGGYAYYTKLGGIEAVSIDERINANLDEGSKRPGKYIPVGQGFFINTGLDPAITGVTINGGAVTFKNSQRIYRRENSDPESGESVFHSQERKDVAPAAKNSSSAEDVEQKRIWLKFRSPKGYHRQILVTADPRTTDNFDLGYDAPLIEDNVEDMYWYFSNYQFVIQGVPDFDLERVLDLGIKVKEKGTFKISIDDLKNIPDEMNIFLADSLLQVVHDLRVGPYEAESEAGVFTDRFKLVFQDKTPTVEPEDPVVIEEGPFEILYVNGTRNIMLRNPELIDVSRVYLNNMLGQQVHVYYDVPLEREVELPVSRFSAGVYIVKVHSEKGVFTKKVILE
ncbi:Ig-like domain-containing protein [Salinimicrobium xinjiangense]|uniref:Ig-like domain-containing protein n=1 Tax=Salinimicrobium xinjiangense TaxID=438596 RepID=UPI00048FB534|nr:T9SS type A sorting domain-containing protein [Salinimicrobium xinjiangense]